VCRAGEPPADFDCLQGLLSPARIAAIRGQKIDMPQIGFSSSEIRRRVAAGISIRYQTHPEVVEFIKQQGLYRDVD
ncbi:MAG: nicotinate-nicotinamide nucleotide adenylyltransferase, partial [Pirellulales bacterium]